MLTFDLQSRKVLFIEIVFGMYNLERQLLMILTFIDETLPLQFAPNLS